MNEITLVDNRKVLVHVLFPMAGQGARFGHTFKPFLTIGPDTFIEAAVRPFRRVAHAISRFVFIYLDAQAREFAVDERLAQMFDGLPITTVHLDAPTRGPAETVSRAVHSLGLDGVPAFVCDCDHEVTVDPLFETASRGIDYDVLLPVWPLDGENVASWSVAMVEDDRVLAIGEKQVPVGTAGTPLGVIGCYGFRDLGEIVERADAMHAVNFSDVIGTMLEEQKVVRAARIRRAVFFGDPQRLASAQARGCP